MDDSGAAVEAAAGAYLTGMTRKEAAVREVAVAYGVSDRTIYGWHEATGAIASGQQRKRDLDDARRAGETATKPTFTLSPYRFEENQTYAAWLHHDAKWSKNLVEAVT